MSNNLDFEEKNSVNGIEYLVKDLVDKYNSEYDYMDTTDRQYGRSELNRLADFIRTLRSNRAPIGSQARLDVLELAFHSITDFADFLQDRRSYRTQRGIDDDEKKLPNRAINDFYTQQFNQPQFADSDVASINIPRSGGSLPSGNLYAGFYAPLRNSFT
jgi:hypothetical protein